MDPTFLISAAIVLFGLTFVFATLLGIAKEKFKVEEDPRIPKVIDALPAANCGGCGFAGCADFAKAVVEDRAEVSGCPVGGAVCAERIAAILGVEVVKTFPYRPVIHCAAKTEDKKGRVPYRGVESCVEADVVGVTQACTYGCLGFGDCVKSCHYDALHLIDGKPILDYDKCTGCGACARACPRNLIELIPFKQEQMLVIACANKEPGKNVKQVCKVGCIGCKSCQRMFAELFSVSDNLASLDYESYSGEEDFQPVIKKCPSKAMIYLGKPKPQYERMLEEEEAAAAST